MGQRGRPKGSKNKRSGAKKNVMDGFLRELPKEERSNAITLSEMTGISVKKIVGDAMAEGLAVLRTEVYADLIRFNERRGKVIHEKDLDKPTLQDNEQLESTDETDTQKVLHDEPADSGMDNGGSVFIPEVERPALERPDVADVRSGLGSEIVKMPGSDQEERGE